MPDIKNIENLVSAYIVKNFKEEITPQSVTMQGVFGGVELDEIDFKQLLAQARTGKEIFSEITQTEGNALVPTVLFDHESIVLHDRVPLNDVKPLTEKDYEVRGTTALLDAVGDSIKHIKNIHKYARQEDRPQKTLFVITTDGMENASHKFNYREIKELITKQKEQGWEFIFIGANIDAVEVASHIGIDARRAVNYHADSKGIAQGFRAIGNFAAAFAAPNLDFDKLFDDDSWRKDIDKDFKDRKK